MDLINTQEEVKHDVCCGLNITKNGYLTQITQITFSNTLHVCLFERLWPGKGSVFSKMEQSVDKMVISIFLQ